jgi:hypothetical protein
MMRIVSTGIALVIALGGCLRATPHTPAPASQSAAASREAEPAGQTPGSTATSDSEEVRQHLADKINEEATARQLPFRVIVSGTDGRTLSFVGRLCTDQDLTQQVWRVQQDTFLEVGFARVECQHGGVALGSAALPLAGDAADTTAARALAKQRAAAEKRSAFATSFQARANEVGLPLEVREGPMVDDEDYTVRFVSPVLCDDQELWTKLRDGHADEAYSAGYQWMECHDRQRIRFRADTRTPERMTQGAAVLTGFAQEKGESWIARAVGPENRTLRIISWKCAVSRDWKQFLHEPRNMSKLGYRRLECHDGENLVFAEDLSP